MRTGDPIEVNNETIIKALNRAIRKLKNKQRPIYKIESKRAKLMKGKRTVNGEYVGSVYGINFYSNDKLIK